MFSVLRSKQVIPNAGQVKNNLKCICVLQYLKCLKGSSYAEDDRKYFSDFLSTIASNTTIFDSVVIPENIPTNFYFNFSEINSLFSWIYYLFYKTPIKHV